ncbi:hypothetical protein GN156_14480 [bacterium LRH843]|nr:hypothetical protein [bacterium LRH843]
MNEDDRELTFKFIYLPLVRKVMEQDLIKIRQAGLKFESPYMTLIENKILQISKEIGMIKREMMKRSLSVYENRREIQSEATSVLKYLIVCRGYREEFNPDTILVKNNVEKIMRTYFI